jgi:hypothetical protein
MSRPDTLEVENLLSGESGIVAGPRAQLRARLADLADDVVLRARLVPPRLARAARAGASGKVLVLGIYGGDYADSFARARDELGRSGRELQFAFGALDSAPPELAAQTVASGLHGRGKFENLNALLERVSWRERDWVVVVDDDVELPRGLLDQMLYCAERLGLQLVQPALRHTSHAAWAVCRRERGTIARQTRLVEIGPLTAFHRSVAAELLPFPPLRMGWGLDLHWGALALERGWRLGIVDAVPVRHELRATASRYDRSEAVEELRHFLAERPHIDRKMALTVVQRHCRLDFQV